ncbi:hypothetical protein DSAG12_00144 [Promethearchaeum syntrophicum]|uniref:Uncharacterized protein n=1 Tax=Promethearchaeum syntrophicum TaxID=2594042 RepID=A0A5B9D5W3_9ARCH|nr:hypothetical protein [Candidatus Prometheoarchaeum syntrophicum]QEE14331.1 hypothetical protein DSAG12_00144 [Candidatus Prometheoarchaeum syntrophicum]
MSFTKYKKWLIIYCIMFFIFLIAEFVMPPFEHFYNFTITGSQNHDNTIILFSILIFSLLGGFLGGYFLSPLFIIIQMKVIGRNLIYATEDKPNSIKFKDFFSKIIFPSLFAFNLAFLLYKIPTVRQFILTPSYYTDTDPITNIFVISALLPLVIAIAMIVFAPAYFIIDAGLIHTNKEKDKDVPIPTEVVSVGALYLNFLKGYAGIAVIINFYTLIFEISESLASGGTMTIIFSIAWPIMPLLIAFIILPVIIAFDVTFDSRKQYILKFCRKMGINKTLTIQIETNKEEKT